MEHKNYGDFSSYFVNEVDLFIGEYFDKKREESDLDFIKDLYLNLKEFCLRPGKRIRPLLLIAGYLGYGGDKENIDEIVKLAAVVEIMHSFLLVHDDIIDKSLIRRGKKSLHIIAEDKFISGTKNSDVGSDVGIILGDILCFNTVEIIADSDIDPVLKDKFLRIYSYTYEKTAWGQVLDIINTLPVKIVHDKEIPMQISLMKTAYYTITNPLIMGSALSGKTSEKDEEIIKGFSIPLGLAFQIRDDLLGVFGKTDKIGKSSNSDLMESKYTLLIAETIERLSGKEREDFISLFRKEEKTDEDIVKLKDIIQSENGLSRAIENIHQFTEESRKNLENMEIKTDIKNILSEIIEKIEGVELSVEVNS